MLADRYELDHEIGRGGMGAVWLGRDTVLGRAVAIKQIGMASAAGEPDLERAEREARLAARVNHQHVVAVYDLVFDRGHQWLVMEHVDGPSLAAMIAEHGALEVEAVAPVVEQVAGALAAAHEHGIVHRDVKPSNILLTQEGVAKLSDFGIARAQADASLTQTGLLTGSPAYLSPEVATGRTATTASDVWSFGATVFHALAGRPPYEVGDNILGAMYRIVHDEPPRLDDGGRLTELVAAMMQHDPEARPTMSEVERTLADSAPPLLEDPDATQGFAAFVDDPEPAPTPTTAFRPLEAPLPEPADTAAVAPATQRLDQGHRRGGPGRLWLGAAGAAVVAIVVVMAVVIGNRDSPNDNPSARGGSSQKAAPSPAGKAEAPAPEGPSAKALEGFAADYLTVADNDPEEGFTMLTPEYQQSSGGIDGYTAFWGDVDDLDVQRLESDPENLTVSYTYSYRHRGKPHTEDVTLQLVEADDSFLISGAS